jgi:carboxymethylenebutenolidase
MPFSAITGVAKTAIHTPAEGLKQGLIDMPSFDGSVQAYYAVAQQSTNRAVVLVVQEIFGLHEHIQDVCRRFAHEGYFAVAVNLYQRQGNVEDYTEIPDLIRSVVAKVPDEQVLADLDASARWAATQGADAARQGVTGFCWGGRLAWLYAAHNPDCRAAVAWYGKLCAGHGPLQKINPIDIAGSLRAPVLGLYGGLDASIPAEDVERMRAALRSGNAAAQTSELVVYPKAGHAFFADYRPSYRKQDAADGWHRALAWFNRYLA